MSRVPRFARPLVQADRTRRVGARLFDVAMITVLAAVVGFVLGGLRDLLVGSAWVVVLTVLVAMSGYDWFWHASCGRTPGKFVFGVKLVRMGEGAPRVGVLRSTARAAVTWSAPIVAALVALAASVTAVPWLLRLVQTLTGIMLVALLWSYPSARRTWHDRMSGTVVVLVRKPRPPR